MVTSTIFDYLSIAKRKNVLCSILWEIQKLKNRQMLLSIYLSIYLSIFPSLYLSIYPFIYLSFIYPSINLSIYILRRKWTKLIKTSIINLTMKLMNNQSINQSSIIHLSINLQKDNNKVNKTMDLDILLFIRYK